MKNLEIKKMSLANIDGKLTPEEMDSIMAGSYSCSDGLALCGLTFVFFGGTPLGWGSCAAIMLGCR